MAFASVLPAFAPSILVAFIAASLPVFAYDWLPAPWPPGNYITGWQGLSELPDAQIINDWPVSGTNNVIVIRVSSSGLDPSEVTRAIITAGGKIRDHWDYWMDVKVDVEADSGNANTLYWDTNGWFNGHYAVGPNTDDKIGPFDVFDSVADYYFNETLYPKIGVTRHDAKIGWIVADPASYIWLVEDRPVAVANCEGIDDYKWGLSGNMPGYSTADFDDIGRQGIVSRFLERYVHYALGTADTGSGDNACQSRTQGSSHFERGQNYIAMLKAMQDGGMPTTQTLDFIEGISHNDIGMFNSTQLRQKMFKLNANDTSSLDTIPSR
ncbi:hypothetical protein K435DRAFT_867872 [Dendrothele bispora CBS 962.96]|uniref:Uncharacterized protein n=1 Tax=Dendrothele bispora (strain CBS 962.96) TaxID=1314807 RepID=A0A4S8LD30_DENBC|nr:hypothetical protein K435DRAFT_867872 [Dendrothele bispora CBS 962.96]